MKIIQIRIKFTQRIIRILSQQLIIVILCVLPLQSYAQIWKLYRYEVSFGVGTANYSGPIGKSCNPSGSSNFNGFNSSQVRPSIYGGIGYKIRNRLALKINLIGAMIYASDAGYLRLQTPLLQHDVSFTTLLLEPSSQLEFYLLPEDKGKSSSVRGGRRGRSNNFNQISLYVFAGIGAVLFKPDVTPLANNPNFYTENENFQTDRVITYGIGVKMFISGSLSICYEWGQRSTNTNYLDGIKPFTDASTQHDKYYIGTFKLCYKIKTARNGLPNFLNFD